MWGVGMQQLDFSKYPLSDKFYGGSEKKIGIVMNGNNYMVKFQKKTASVLYRSAYGRINYRWGKSA